MFKGESLLNILLLDLLLGAAWHYLIFFLCVSIETSHFDPSKKLYQPHKWERGGRFYSDVLKINRWKDSLPQHIGKDGFSKDHLDDVTLEYLDQFIMETCRGEWNHTLNCVFAVVLFIINDFWLAVILTVCLLVGNLPFLVIQRYNRFRLQKLREVIVRREKRSAATTAG